MVTINVDRRALYALLGVVVLAAALLAGYFLSRGLSRPASAPPAVSAPTVLPNVPPAPPAAGQAGAAPTLVISSPVPDTAPRIELAEAKAIHGQPGVVFVDVRQAEQYAQGHIQGAISFPEADMQTRFQELPQDKDLILYCA